MNVCVHIVVFCRCRSATMAYAGKVLTAASGEMFVHDVRFPDGVDGARSEWTWDDIMQRGCCPHCAGAPADEAAP